MENVKHLSVKKLEVIEDCSCEMARLEKGTRQVHKKRDRFVIENAPKYCTRAKSLPNSFSVLYMCTSNLGTKKYPDTYYTYYMCGCSKKRGETVRETDHSLIIEGKDGYRRVIRKDKIVCFVW